MKNYLISISFLSTLLVASSAMADDSNSVQQPVTAAGQASTRSGYSDQGGTIIGSSDSGQPSTGLTRSDVKRQLIHSEQDGQLAKLNSTLYKGQ